MNKAIIIVPIISILLGATAQQQIAYAQNQTLSCTGVGSCYDQGYAQGQANPRASCTEAQKAIQTDNYINYCAGLLDGSAHSQTSTTTGTSQSFLGRDFGDFSNLSNIPLIGGLIASHSIATGVLHNEQGVFIPWNLICQKGSQYLLESCANLLNPDGSLTAKGDTAVGCIRNGFAAAILGTKLGLSFDAIKSALGFAAGATGCGGIVDLNQIQNSPDFQSLLGAVPGH